MFGTLQGHSGFFRTSEAEGIPDVYRTWPELRFLAETGLKNVCNKSKAFQNWAY